MEIMVLWDRDQGIGSLGVSHGMESVRGEFRGPSNSGRNVSGTITDWCGVTEAVGRLKGIFTFPF